MTFKRLPSNSETLLLSLVSAQKPVQVLQAQYKGLSLQQREELDDIIRELKKYGYIDVTWADNEPFGVTLNNSARTYIERLAEYNTKEAVSQEQSLKNTIFVSHRSTDKNIADMLVDFLSGTGIPKAAISVLLYLAMTLTSAFLMKLNLL